MSERQRHDLRFWSILLTGAAVIAGRYYSPGHGLSVPGTVEAFSHIWIGLMLGVVVFAGHVGLRVTAGVVLVAASAYELVMFLTR